MLQAQIGVPGGLTDHWGQTKRDREDDSVAPNASHAEGLPSEAGGGVGWGGGGWGCAGSG